MDWGKKRKSKPIVIIMFIAMLLQCMPLVTLAGITSTTSAAAVGEWYFNEEKGMLAEDSSGNGNNGTIIGATWVDGKKGSALSFDGIDDYVEIPHDALLSPNTALTIEAWVNPASNTVWQRIVSKSYHPNTDYSLFRGDKNNVGFSIKMGTVNRTVYSPADSVPIGTWTYVVGTYDGTRLRIYVNGTQVNSLAISGKINVHAEPLRIGGDPQGDFFKGMIDEVSIFNRALTAAEVLSRYEKALFKTQAKLEAGRNISVLLKENGTVWASGFNGYGQLGDGTTVNRYKPVQAKGLEGIGGISVGDIHILALKRTGTVWAWGANGFGELGDGTTINRYEPIQVKGLEGVAAISAGNSYSLALKEDGTVWEWGAKRDYSAENKTWIPITEPVQVQGLQQVTAIAAGKDYNLVLKKDGTVWAWGDNEHGQLGNGTTTLSTEPVQVQGLEGVVAISTNIYHSIALKEDGTIWAWGYNYYGQLGDGTQIDRTEPVQVQNLEGVAAISVGCFHSMAWKEDGTIWAWGDNFDGQLGDGTQIDRIEPVQVQGLEEVVEISGGYMHSLAIKPDGTVWAWGYNGFGSFGDGTSNSSNLPVYTGNKIK